MHAHLKVAKCIDAGNTFSLFILFAIPYINVYTGREKNDFCRHLKVFLVILNIPAR